MDLAEAVEAIRTKARVKGQSNADLVNLVTRHGDFPKGHVVVPVACIKEHIDLRPAEALHRLAIATRPRPHDDAAELYRLWGLARYHAFFECDSSDGLLRVSNTGAQIVGTQRRHVSEDLGIGFGVLLAERWLQASAPSPRALNLVDPVDIDVALRWGSLSVAGREIEVSAGHRYPDYLLVANDPSKSPRHFRVHVLECKGTSDPSIAVPQLARATGQLGSLLVDGQRPSGLAVSTVAAGDTVQYRALELPGDDRLHEAPMDLLTPDQTVLDFNTARIRTDASPLDARLSDLPSEVLVAAALRVSWARLAGLADDANAARRWAPNAWRGDLAGRPSVDTARLERPPTTRTPYGEAVGRRTRISFGRQTLTVFHGVAKPIIKALSTDGPGAVLSAQAKFANELSARHRRSQARQTTRAHAASPDGAILSISLSS